MHELVRLSGLRIRGQKPETESHKTEDGSHDDRTEAGKDNLV